jgi:hemerythrin-like domain-containing protein
MIAPVRSARRAFLLASGGAALGIALVGRASRDEAAVSSPKQPAQDEEKAKEVTANEDLMREHGVLRRALLVYHLTAARLRRYPAEVSPDALNATAKLFRTFGEDYHERQLEEPHIFPVVRRSGPAADRLVNTLLAQHSRGREITDYIVGQTKGGRIGTGAAEPLAHAMDAMVLMYQEHTAREDTIVFPAWKQALSGKQYDEMNDKFEDIEHRMFGKDGFEDAVKQISGIERTLGLADLAQFTAPPPPQL